jgi:hypothetical protein
MDFNQFMNPYNFQKMTLRKRLRTDEEPEQENGFVAVSEVVVESQNQEEQKE